jgi:fructokinase
MSYEPEKTASMRIGIDLGGTKIAILAMGENGETLFEERRDTPKHDYEQMIGAIAEMVGKAERETGRRGSVGIGAPGSIAPRRGTVQNANSEWLNDRPFKQDMERALKREVRLANDANCFALSEAVDGAGAGARTLFGVIIGTGCGGGVVIDGRLVNGPRNIGCEWGHNPLPWSQAVEHPGPQCWCGRRGCLETFVSGTALENDHAENGGERLTGEEIAELAAKGDERARETLKRHVSRLGRGLAMMVNIIDPDIIVLGGGLSNMAHLYEELPAAIAPYVFAEDKSVKISPPRHGDASGARGAAWLWD